MSAGGILHACVLLLDASPYHIMSWRLLPGLLLLCQKRESAALHRPDSCALLCVPALRPKWQEHKASCKTSEPSSASLRWGTQCCIEWWACHGAWNSSRVSCIACECEVSSERRESRMRALLRGLRGLRAVLSTGCCQNQGELRTGLSFLQKALWPQKKSRGDSHASCVRLQAARRRRDKGNVETALIAAHKALHPAALPLRRGHKGRTVKKLHLRITHTSLLCSMLGMQARTVNGGPLFCTSKQTSAQSCAAAAVRHKALLAPR